MKGLLYTIILVMLLAGWSAHAQALTGTIKGSVHDRETRQALIGAQIMVLNTSLGAATNALGEFSLSEVPAGRVSLQISYLGYETILMSNLQLSSAKEMVLNIEMEESIIKSEEVVITAEADKGKPNNELATVSVRKFTVEESAMFAGARNDVSRMAANFAGVQASNDQANDIVIRGNSPNALLWRLEGVDIPNPNHFGNFGSAGGPVSMLNNNVLSNSDFFTGAFPANYGNTVSGVFDLKMRNGNSSKHEFLGQVGFNGFELGAEGPLSRKSGASYLINARYSTLEVMQNLGLNVGTGTAVPHYKDLTFKLNFPLKNQANFSVFGIGGSSSIDFVNSKADSSEQGDLWSQASQDIYNRTKMGVLGFNYSKLLGANSYMKLIGAYTTQINGDRVDSVAPETRKVYEFYNQNYHNDKGFFHGYYNAKLNAKNTFRAGLIVNHYLYSIKDSVYKNNSGEYLTLTNSQGNTDLWQAYASQVHKFNPRLSATLGLHAQMLALNKKYAIEPRAGLSYKLNSKSALNFGYGLHSYMVPLNFYFTEVQLANGSYVQPNTQLNFTKSHHLVLGFNTTLGRSYHFKAETYWQHVFGAAVGTRNNSTFSTLNMASFDFSAPDSLKNGGTGRNYGLELTLERYLNKGFYLLATTSLFNSTYVANNGQRYNTKFNNGYVLNLLAGKEWGLGGSKSSGSRKSISYDVKLTTAGGQRYTPINQEKSQLAGQSVYVLNQPYSQQFSPYFRCDMRLSFKLMFKGVEQEWAFDVQNVTNHQNPLFQRYNAGTGKVDVSYQLGLFPIMQYRIIF